MTANKNQTVIFVHVPKTAGETLGQIIARQYPDEAYLTFETDITGMYAEFLESDVSERSRYSMIKGHIPYGTHRYIERECRYFTFLREPIERTISHYYYLARMKSHPLAEQSGDTFVSFDELLLRGLDRTFFNSHTRLLSGVWYDAEPGMCTREHLEMAKENLRKKFTVVGLTEKFDESLMLLQDAFSWKDLRYFRANVTKNRPTKASLSPETLALVENANVLDKELYLFGRELFDKKMEGRRDEIDERVKRFRRANRLYGLIHSTIYAVRQRSVRAFIREHWPSRKLL
ncbi:MAG: sulfotransferase family 2 domain-containing protein [Candidatus Promineifilaceae bacterium]